MKKPQTLEDVARLIRADCVWLDENGKIVWDDERALDILEEYTGIKEEA